MTSEGNARDVDGPPRGTRRRWRRVLYSVVGVIVAAGIVTGYLAGRRERQGEQEREAPVAAPSRLRDVPTPAGARAAVVLDSATEARVGIRTRVLGASTRRDLAVSLSGELIADPARVTTVRAPVPGRLAAIAGAWPAFGDSIAAGRPIAQVSDALPIVAPQSGIVTHIGARPGEMVQAGQELMQLTDFRELLVRVVWRADVSLSPPPTVAVAPLGGRDNVVAAEYVGPDVAVDTLTRAPAFLYRIAPPWQGARPGLPMTATIHDPRAQVTGVVVPTDAVVQWEGLAWVYVRREVPAQAGRPPERAYTRVRIDTDHPLSAGWLVPVAAGSIEPGQSVVVRGAQQLLSEEFRARVQVGEKNE